MSGRSRPASSLPKPPTTLASSAVIADSAAFTGTNRIIIGSEAIIHPRAKLTSTYGPVTIRTGCIISEKAHIGLQESYKGDSEDSYDVVHEVVLEPNVVVEPAAVVEARSVGQGTVLEAGCRVGAGAVIGEYCKVTPLCTIMPGEVLPDYTIAFGNNQRRTEKPGLEHLRARSHRMEIEVLRKLIPSNLAKFQSS